MKTIPLYVNSEIPLTPQIKGITVSAALEIVLSNATFKWAAEEVGVVVVVAKDTHDALLSDELTKDRTYIVSNAALQEETCAIDAKTATPFDATCFARIELGRVQGCTPMFVFPLVVGEPVPGAAPGRFVRMEGARGN